jgi:hypothetical protein
MIAVIFEVFPADGRKGDYLEHAARLESELERVGWVHVRRAVLESHGPRQAAVPLILA